MTISWYRSSASIPDAAATWVSIQSFSAQGRLEKVSDGNQPRAATAISENANVPTLNVLPDTAPEDRSMTFYRLVPEELSGRKFEDSLLTPTES